jgi:dipeptide/tripeptide permease
MEPQNKVKKSKKQTKWHSFWESLSNEGIGYLINTTIQIIVFPFVGLNLSFNLNLFVSAIHSAFGFTRIFVLRRIFNYKFRKHTKRMSFYECILNIIAGTIISFIVQMFLYPVLGIPLTLGNNLYITALFLIITLVRLYVLRRFFHKKTKKAHKLAKTLARGMIE